VRSVKDVQDVRDRLRRPRRKYQVSWLGPCLLGVSIYVYAWLNHIAFPFAIQNCDIIDGLGGYSVRDLCVASFNRKLW
jgi:hypothetical protein